MEQPETQRHRLFTAPPMRCGLCNRTSATLRNIFQQEDGARAYVQRLFSTYFSRFTPQGASERIFLSVERRLSSAAEALAAKFYFRMLTSPEKDKSVLSQIRDSPGQRKYGFKYPAWTHWIYISFDRHPSRSSRQDI